MTSKKKPTKGGDESHDGKGEQREGLPCLCMEVCFTVGCKSACLFGCLDLLRVCCVSALGLLSPLAWFVLDCLCLFCIMDCLCLCLCMVEVVGFWDPVEFGGFGVVVLWFWWWGFSSGFVTTPLSACLRRHGSLRDERERSWDERKITPFMKPVNYPRV